MGWVIIRGAWFFDFLSQIMIQVSQEPRGRSLAACAQKAYKIGLQRHHPWIVQKAVHVGMNAAAYREVFEKKMIEEQARVQKRPYTTVDVYKDLLITADLCDQLAKHIWKLFKDRGLDEIP